MDIQETVNRHGQWVVDGNMGGVMGDFEPAALQAFGAQGVMPPRPTTKYEVMAERTEGDQCIYEVRYSNDQGQHATIRSHWKQMGDAWKIVQAEGVKDQA